LEDRKFKIKVPGDSVSSENQWFTNDYLFAMPSQAESERALLGLFLKIYLNNLFLSIISFKQN